MGKKIPLMKHQSILLSLLTVNSITGGWNIAECILSVQNSLLLKKMTYHFFFLFSNWKSVLKRHLESVRTTFTWMPNFSTNDILVTTLCLVHIQLHQMMFVNGHWHCRFYTQFNYQFLICWKLCNLINKLYTEILVKLTTEANQKFSDNVFPLTNNKALIKFETVRCGAY